MRNINLRTIIQAIQLLDHADMIKKVSGQHFDSCYEVNAAGSTFWRSRTLIKRRNWNVCVCV